MFIAGNRSINVLFLCLNNDFTNFWILKKKIFPNIDGTKGKLRMPKEFFLKISYNINNGQGYSLIVTINPSSQSHYFCTIYEPFDGKIQQQG